jgi:hypothetical protein
MCYVNLTAPGHDSHAGIQPAQPCDHDGGLYTIIQCQVGCMPAKSLKVCLPDAISSLQAAKAVSVQSLSQSGCEVCFALAIWTNYPSVDLKSYVLTDTGLIQDCIDSA